MNDLERIGLISRVCSELDNHLGFSDKTLAEFIIHLASIHSTTATFHKALQENGAEVPMSFAANLLRIIHTITQQTKNVAAQKNKVPINPSRSAKDKDFFALRISNTAAVPLEGLPRELSDAELAKYQREKEMREREAAEAARRKDPSRRDEDYYRDRRDRSRSPERDRYSRGLDDSRRPRSRSRSPHRRGSSSEVQLYGIYDGKVSNVLDFGCFVELQGFTKREGLVHVAQVHSGNSRDIKSFVKRGDRVKVKVISISGSKLALSMKEVDQATGQDLLPQRSKEGIQKMAAEVSNPAPPSSRLDNRGIDMRKIREQELEDETHRKP